MNQRHISSGSSGDRSLDILMISYWDFQETGMQVTRRTPFFFADQGHWVTFMVHSETTANPCRSEVRHPRLRMIRFDLPLKWMNKFRFIRRPRQLILFAWSCLRSTRKIYRDRKGPDIIYAAEADAVLIGTILRRIYHVPLVTRFYGVSRLESHFDFAERRLKPIGLRHYFSRLAVSRRADLIVVTDDGSHGGEIVKALNSRTRNIRSWRNGVDAPLIERKSVSRVRAALGVGTKKFILLTLCRLDHWKGVDLAVEALGRVPPRLLRSFRLVIAGDGPELAPLRRLVESRGLGEHIVFAGPVAHDDVYSYYGLADVFLSLYRYSNVGNPLWEALNSGSCILTIDTRGTGDVIRDGFNGRLLAIEPDEKELIDNIARSVLELYSQPALRKRLREGALAYSRRTLWSWEKRLAAELQAIQELIPDETSSQKLGNPKRGLIQNLPSVGKS